MVKRCGVSRKIRDTQEPKLSFKSFKNKIDILFYFWIPKTRKVGKLCVWAYAPNKSPDIKVLEDSWKYLPILTQRKTWGRLNIGWIWISSPQLLILTGMRCREDGCHGNEALLSNYSFTTRCQDQSTPFVIIFSMSCGITKGDHLRDILTASPRMSACRRT